MSKHSKYRDAVIGVIGAGFALLTLLVWIPADIETGVIDEWRRSVRIGDSMLPTFAIGGMLLASLVIGFRAFVSPPEAAQREMYPRFHAISLFLFVIGFALMIHTGPVIYAWATSDDSSYRMVFDTAPWKYLGFFSGGTVVILGFTGLASRSLSWPMALIATIATVIIALLYDLPFDNLLLPPNGDL